MVQACDHMVKIPLASPLCAYAMVGLKTAAEHPSEVVDSMSCSCPWQPHQPSWELPAVVVLDRR